MTGTVKIWMDSPEAAKEFADHCETISIDPSKITQEQWLTLHRLLFAPLIQIRVNEPSVPT